MCTGAEILLLAGTAVTAVTAVQQGQEAKKQARRVAGLAEEDAAIERSAAQKRADRIRRAGGSQQAEAQAALAASGVEVSAGTPLTIEQEIGRRAEDDAMEELLYGSRAGSRLEQEAGAQRRAGKKALQAGYMGAGSSVLYGGSKLAQGWRTGTVAIDT